MKYEAIVIGSGLSGLTAASLLAKRGVKVLVIEKQFKPGGSCGIFKRSDVIFDQGTAMLYGFGDAGFNPHRFVFNCLEEPIEVIKHDLLYTVVFEGKRIRFFSNVERFVEELSSIFPGQSKNIARFYRDMELIYEHVMVERPVYATPDETNPLHALAQLVNHPLSYFRFISYLFRSAGSVLKKYFDDPTILRFFNKLTSTYCYTTVDETPAVLAAIMFIDNHVGGSFYPAGSTLYLPGKLEKSIEENGGDMLYEQEVGQILIRNNQAVGVELTDGTQIEADAVIYSGTVWNLYGRMISEQYLSPIRKAWAKAMVPTYPSVVFYAEVDSSVIPDGTCPVEMLVGNPDQIDEGEVTVYIFSIDDHTLCPAGRHTVMAIGPSFRQWPAPVGDYHSEDYLDWKEAEERRLTAVLEQRFPGFTQAIYQSELATPVTIERYTLKNGGSVAGPKQMIGQHMLHRLHTCTEWRSLYCCGESTVMGTGSPAVTVSGISAANAVLHQKGLKPFVYDPHLPNLVRILQRPVKPGDQNQDLDPYQRELIRLAGECQFCEDPACMNKTKADIRGIMRRAAVGNFAGARKLIAASGVKAKSRRLIDSEQRCIRTEMAGSPVAIRLVFEMLETVP